jgi:hypothetical protein
MTLAVPRPGNGSGDQKRVADAAGTPRVIRPFITLVAATTVTMASALALFTAGGPSWRSARRAAAHHPSACCGGSGAVGGGWTAVGAIANVALLSLVICLAKGATLAACVVPTLIALRVAQARTRPTGRSVTDPFVAFDVLMDAIAQGTDAVGRALTVTRQSPSSSHGSTSVMPDGGRNSRKAGL